MFRRDGMKEGVQVVRRDGMKQGVQDGIFISVQVVHIHHQGGGAADRRYSHSQL